MLLMLLLFWFYGVRISYGQAGSPWNTEDNDYYYDQLEPEDLLPNIVTQSQDFSVQPGEDVTLPCVVDRGWHSLVWRRGGNILWVLQNSDGHFLLQSVTRDDRLGRSNTSLTIKDIQATDEGTYTCELSDTVPPRNVKHVLKVRVPPEVFPANGRKIMTIKMGSTANLGCYATGNPEPNITWSIGGRQLKVGDNLTIVNAGPDDNGKYRCTARNGVGLPASTTITLEVMHPPVVRAQKTEVYTGVGHEATIACFVYAEPRAQVKFYRKGGTPVDPMRLLRTVNNLKRYSLQFTRVHLEDLGDYTCNATNFMGNDSASVKLSARPKPVRYVSPSQGEMENNYTLVWDVESYVPVLAYDIAYRNDTDGEDEWITFTVPGTTASSKYHSMSHTFTDLEPGSTYHVRVAARNEYGRGDVNESFSFTTLDSGGTDYPSYIQTSVEVSVDAISQSEDIVPGAGVNIVSSQENPEKSAAASEALVNQTKPDDIAKTEVSVAGQAVTHDDSSAANALNPKERKIQMMALVTAISLSFFFC
ncbi:neuronal growth regulator 1-like [Penaeus japonicus]|uniref:neuronal growth regulator 1-like n=1 Tax=Penaeus japonicus TaxID=27405 RepID=UPI001C71244C|nr:neuronal growth regulator 1-like [Penaeus japonicus]